MYQYIQLDFSAGVGRLTLNRPDKRNALKREFIAEIHAGIHQLQSNPDLRVLVLAGNGSVFCAGMDLSEMQQRAESSSGKAEWQKDSEVYCELLTALFELQVPTIAVAAGPVLAGGLGLVLACDILLASENVFFLLPEPLRGITAAMVTPLLIHRVGPGPAAFMLLSGERINASAARQFNLCHEVVVAADFDARVETLIASVLTGSKSALAMTKQHMRKCLPTDLVSQIKASVKISAEARETPDAREGLAAFLEKRKPYWQTER